MSHAPERKEKDCLNCGTIIHGRFCHVCGQENIVPKESFWNLVTHFFYDITHFDSKFFDSLRYLLFRPGFLPREFIKGRRASYLNPVKMYVFTSAIFFLVFFSLFDAEHSITYSTDKVMTAAERQDEMQDLRDDLAKDPEDSTVIRQQIALLADTTRDVTMKDVVLLDTSARYYFLFYEIPYKNHEEYDSVQHSLASAKRDGWFKSRIVRRGIDVSNDIRYNRKESLKALVNDFFHKLPYLLFVSLPFFALILKLLYIRKKQFFYAEHGIFSIHHYIFSFILLLLVFGLNRLETLTGYRVFSILNTVFILGWVIYLYVAMRNFYRQSWLKTFVKFLLLNVLGLVMVLLLFVIFVLITILF